MTGRPALTVEREVTPTDHTPGEDANPGRAQQMKADERARVALQTRVGQSSLDSIQTAEKKDGAQEDTSGSPDLGTFWGLLILGLAYVHHSTSG